MIRHFVRHELRNSDPAHIRLTMLLTLAIIALPLLVLSVGEKQLTKQLAAVLSGPPPASGKQFTTLPPGASLPSGADCATRIRRTTWEPRPQNTSKNQYIPTKGTDFTIQTYNGTNGGIWIGDHPQRANALQNRLDGNFTGTTDEILQWIACKWGVDEDYVRAQAVVESNWEMAANGDNGESFGILQVRLPYHGTAFPGAQKSTAFNADYTYMRWRLCFEGLVDYLGQTNGSYAAGDPWGCMGAWYTGNWYGDGGGYGGGAQSYINVVKQRLAERTWESWTGIQVTSAVTQPVNPTPTRTPTAIPTGTVSGTRVNTTIFLHGIGKGGDNVNAQSTGNQNPLHKQRIVQVRLYGTNGQLVQAILDGSITYNSSTGNFTGTIPLGSIPSGFYTVKVTVPLYLTKTVPGIVSITQGQVTTIPTIALVAGDSLVDNRLDIKDYNLLLDCFSDLMPARNCSDAAKKQATDITDDGNVNQFDYNLFLRELSVQTGDGGSVIVPTSAISAAPDSITSCLNHSGQLRTISGMQTTRYDSRSALLPSGGKVDARTAIWKGIHDYPIIIAGGTGICFSGGTVEGLYSQTTTWDVMHSTNAIEAHPSSVTIEKVRIINYGDAISFKEQANSFTVRGVYISYNRDDCIENDWLHTGLVEDSLLDGCYEAFSARTFSGQAVVKDGSNNIWTIRNNLVRLQPMEKVYKDRGVIPGHDGFFKWDTETSVTDKGPQLALHNNIFRVDQPANNVGLGLPLGKLTSCSNNIMVWLGTGDYPAQLPTTFNGQPCFTITREKSVWDDAVSVWKARHGY